MWFNNALIYRCEDIDVNELEQALSEQSLKPCPSHSRSNYGWLEGVTGSFAHCAQGFHFITLGKNEKILPASVINQYLSEKISDIELAQDRKVKGREKAQMKEDLEFELLPKAFCITKKLHALYDQSTQRLIVNTSSANQANHLLALLRKTINGIRIEPVSIDTELSLTFTHWVTNPNSLPVHLSLAPNCQLHSPKDENIKLNCKGYELPADEILQLIDQGLVVNELNLLWHERLQFSLNNQFIIKRIKCIDYLLDEVHEINKTEDPIEQFDANLCLLGNELKQMINDIIELTQGSNSNNEQNTSQQIKELTPLPA